MIKSSSKITHFLVLNAVWNLFIFLKKLKYCFFCHKKYAVASVTITHTLFKCSQNFNRWEKNSFFCWNFKRKTFFLQLWHIFHHFQYAKQKNSFHVEAEYFWTENFSKNVFIKYLFAANKPQPWQWHYAKITKRSGFVVVRFALVVLKLKFEEKMAFNLRNS